MFAEGFGSECRPQAAVQCIDMQLLFFMGPTATSEPGINTIDALTPKLKMFWLRFCSFRFRTDNLVWPFCTENDQGPPVFWYDIERIHKNLNGCGQEYYDYQIARYNNETEIFASKKGLLAYSLIAPP